MNIRTTALLLIIMPFFTVVEGCVTMQKRDDYCLLSLAAYSGDVKLVRTLLDAGRRPEGCSEFVNQPIYNAVMFGHAEVVRQLIDAGISPNYVWVETGGTLIETAAQVNQMEVVQLLLELGADVNLSVRRSALFVAITHGYEDLRLLLEKNGATLNDKEKQFLEKLEIEYTR